MEEKTGDSLATGACNAAEVKSDAEVQGEKQILCSGKNRRKTAERQDQ